MKFLQLTAAALLLAAQTATAQAPTYEWTNAWRSNTGGVPDVNNLTTDMDGNSYAVGTFTGVADFDDSADSAILDAANGRYFILKTSPTGALLWAKQSALNYRLSYANGAIYAATEFVGTVDINPSTGTTSITSAGQRDALIIKFDTAMATIAWHKVIGTANQEAAYLLSTTADGKIFVSGYFNSAVDMNPGTGTTTLTPTVANQYNGFYMMLDNNGDFLWAQKYESSRMDLADINTSTNDIYVSFVQYATDTINGTPFPLVGDYDAVLAKTNPTTGAFTWIKSFGEPSESAKLCVLPRVNGNISLGFTSFFTGTLDYDPSAAVANFTHSSSAGFVFVTFDGSGNFVSVAGVDASNSSYVELKDAKSDYLGNLYVFGQFNGTIDFAPTTAINNQTAPALTEQTFLMSLDNALAVNFIEISDSGLFFLNGLHIDNRGNIFTYGSVTSGNNATMDYDFSTGTDYEPFNSNGTYKGMITKMSQPTFVGVTANDAVAASKLFPNPAAHLINIENAVVGSQLRVTDALGRVVLQARINNENTQIATDLLSNGLYFFQIQQAGKNSSEMHKVIIAK